MPPSSTGTSESALDRCAGADPNEKSILVLGNVMSSAELDKLLLTPKDVPHTAVTGSDVIVCSFTREQATDPSPSLTMCPDGLVDISELDQQDYLLLDDGSLLRISLRTPADTGSVCS
jgi:hypothetical protein